MLESCPGKAVYDIRHRFCVIRSASCAVIVGLLLAVLPAASAATPANGKSDFQIHLGYMADSQARDRVNVQDLVSYIDALQAAFKQVVGSGKTPFAIDVVAMAKPGGRSRVWLVPHGAVPKDIDLGLLKSALDKVPGPRVRIGPICLALMYSVNGANRTDLPTKGAPQPPMPDEWKEILGKAPQGKQLLEYFPLFWPDDEADLAAMRARTIRVPEGFELQILEPLGGKIARPKGWFFDQGGTPSGYVWTISRDKTESGGFVVGMRIQLLAKVKEGTGQSPKEFVNGVINQIKPTTKVLSECPESEVGFFQRRCLETEGVVDCAGNKELIRDMYSFFWSDPADLVVISIFGAPPGQWDDLAKIRETMNEFELIDMKRFGEAAADRSKAK